MKISVAMTTFNGGCYLPEQLESIRRQSLLPAELVVCDDGSTDDTLEVLREFATTAPFPVVLDAHGERLGFTQNFLRAIRRCTGDVIALCDQDDAWESRKLATCTPPFADPAVMTVTHRVRVTDEQLRPTGLVLPPARYRGEYTVRDLDPWFAPNGMQMLFRRAPLVSWLEGEAPDAIYGYGKAPFDEWIFFAGTLAGRAVVLGDDLGVWRRHGAVASQPLDEVAQDHDPAHQLRLALNSGREAYAFRAAVTEARGDFAAQVHVLPDGSRLAAVPGAVEFYRRMARTFRRRACLHDAHARWPDRLKTFVQMGFRRDYRSKDRGGLGSKAILKDAFTVCFGPRADRA